MSKKPRCPKNRYCVDSNLSESAFLFVVLLFGRGKLPSEALRIFHRWCRITGEKPISRQALNTYFVRIGHHIYEHWTVRVLSILLVPPERDIRTRVGQMNMRGDDCFLCLLWADLQGYLDNESFAALSKGQGGGRGPMRGVIRPLRARFSKARGFDPEHFRAHVTAVLLQSSDRKKMLEYCKRLFLAIPLDRDYPMCQLAIDLMKMKKHVSVRQGHGEWWIRWED